MDRRRRQVALSFLNSISLDGQPVEEDGSQSKAEDGVRFMSSASVSTTRSQSISGEDYSKDSCKEEPGGLTEQAAVGRCLTDPDLKQTSRHCAIKNESVNISRELQSKSVSVVRPRSSRRVHFIKNMRQHDTRNGRIVLISVRRALYGMFSILPYRDYSQTSDERLDSSRQKHLSVAAKETVAGFEGVEAGAKGKTVSYTKLLYHTNVLSGNSSSVDVFAQHSGSQSVFSPAHGAVSQSSVHRGIRGKDVDDYDPNLLDDPQWLCGKHKRVLVFPSYMTTVIEYVKPSDLKKHMNETFSEKFPHVQLTLSKIRSLKREIRKLAQEDCGYEEPTVAMAFVYFEKLALRGKLDKQNRKLCAGACILLAAKISNDLKKPEVKHLIDRLEERLRLNRRELLALEFPVLVALEFKLHLPHQEILPHYRRLLQSI